MEEENSLSNKPSSVHVQIIKKDGIDTPAYESFRNPLSLQMPCWANSYPYPTKEAEEESGCSYVNGDDGLNLSDCHPEGERWPPLGAPNEENEMFVDSKWFEDQADHSSKDKERLKELEEEQEQLNSSLLALTSHFAQVQFRLKQIVDASPTEKENLLLALEEFANRGVPDIRPKIHSPSLETDDPATLLDLGHERQKELIRQLKQQLEDLENYAYETGDADLPQSAVLERQSVIIDELKSKLNLKVDDFAKVPINELKTQVNNAVKEIIHPLRMKDQLVDQLQTQIVDLERFIGFLQDSGPNEFPSVAKLTSNCNCNGHAHPQVSGRGFKAQHCRRNSFRKQWEQEQMKKDTESLIARASSLLNMISFSQIGCMSAHANAGNIAHRRKPKGKTSGKQHWGDLRAALEISISTLKDLSESAVLENIQCDSFRQSNMTESRSNTMTDPQSIMTDSQLNMTDSRSNMTDSRSNMTDSRSNVTDSLPNVTDSRSNMTDSRSNMTESLPNVTDYLIKDDEVTSYVRKTFCPALRSLIQHGMMTTDQKNSLVPFLGCFPLSNGGFDDLDEKVHPWDLILKYYYMKKGDLYNETPARTLSESFRLDMLGGASLSNKKLLLQVIGNILASHGPLKRSHDSHFKAFVSAALNMKKLSTWLRLLFRTQPLVEAYFEPWSYVAKTGFEDALRSIDCLSQFNYGLPVNLAVKPFQNIKDVFN